MKPWAERFYNSDAWRSCRDSFLKSKGYLCERCSTPDDPVTAKIAHHKTYLTKQNMDVWNMAHVEGGEKYYIRKEYAEVSELGKEVTPNAKKDGSGVPNNDPAAIDPDGGGEAN